MVNFSWTILGLILGLRAATFRSVRAQEAPHTRKYFYVGGSYESDATGTAHYFRNQIYVEHLVPVAPKLQPYPIVLIHGLAQTGTNWLNKPDGEPGWASYFLHKGYELYILDITARGRSPTTPGGNSTPAAFTAEVIQTRFTAPENYDLYPNAKLHDQWPDGYGKGVMGNPAFDAYYASIYPSLTAPVPQQSSMRVNGAALLDRIGRPVVLLGHSQGGTLPFLMADARPDLVRSIVALEPAGPPFVEPKMSGGTPARAWGMSDVPMTFSPPVVDPVRDIVKQIIPSNSSEVEPCTLQSDNPPPKQLVNLAKISTLIVTAEASWHMMYDWCIASFLKQAGVRTEQIRLGDVGVHGNGHMLFLERNSDLSAAVVEEWIARH